MKEKLDAERVGRHWDAVSTTPTRLERATWGHVTPVRKHISMRYAKKPFMKHFRADAEFLRRCSGQAFFQRAISVGCGEAPKELGLLRDDFVGQFVLYDLSEVRIARVSAKAREWGLEERVDPRCSDPFGPNVAPEYDLVYWSHALHHMPDIGAALEWSLSVCRSGGWVFFNEYVGGNLLQWRPSELATANAVRALLPESLFRDASGRPVGRGVSSIPADKVRAADPSESVASEDILPAFLEIFPQGVVESLGGVLWHLALRGLHHHFVGMSEACTEHVELLRNLLVLDGLLADQGMSAYAVGAARV